MAAWAPRRLARAGSSNEEDRLKFGIVPTEGGRRYAASLDEVRLAEQAGFASVWLSEHHLAEQHYWGTPMLGLAGYATATRRIVLGANVVVLPFYHPLRLAEEAHLLAIMSEGRFLLGVGMGYREDEYHAYGVDVATRGRRYEEALKLLRPLLRGEQVTHAGRAFQLSEARVRPLASQPVPLWAGGWGEQNLRRAAQYADEWLPGPTADLTKLLAARATIEQQSPRPTAREWPLTRELIIAESDGAALEAAERYLLPNYRDEYGGGWGHPLISGGAAQTDGLAALSANRFIVGGPDTVVELVRAYARDFGTRHIIFRLSSATTPHDFIVRELELLGEHVLPAFAATPGVAGA